MHAVNSYILTCGSTHPHSHQASPARVQPTPLNRRYLLPTSCHHTSPASPATTHAPDSLPPHKHSQPLRALADQSQEARHGWQPRLRHQPFTGHLCGSCNRHAPPPTQSSLRRAGGKGAVLRLSRPQLTSLQACWQRRPDPEEGQRGWEAGPQHGTAPGARQRRAALCAVAAEWCLDPASSGSLGARPAIETA